MNGGFLKGWPLLALLPLLGSCATMRVTAPPVSTIDFVDGRDFIITQPYRYEIGQSGQAIEVPAGFVTDFASIPRVLWEVFPPHGRYGRAAAVHDYLYWSQSCTRKQADNLFMIAMTELGVRPGDRRLIYDGVRAAGGAAWNANANARARGLTKVVPANRWMLATDHSWREAQVILQREGVHDPAFPASADYCALGDSTHVPGPPRPH